ncbi:GNAT family N-acetyltransferase [Flammeovirga sp. SubArs3]|uniref:GNAT family N-acetyltransferase n=1 Tax=Flammeovirga sp. SubArs3 TaxID=2995316 RepID=UPI00248AD7B6|nr:GNAT family N-acetyltransferase [Flammeovirga sp. SubArs3]
MEELIYQITPLDNTTLPPYALLETADPSRELIDQYLEKGESYIAISNGSIIGVVVFIPLEAHCIEIKNIAVADQFQGKGVGKALLRFIEEVCKKKGFHKMVIGTGNSSIGQLALYQQLGFEIEHIEKNFFLDNYSAPIFENKIQCKHMLILEKNLNI